MYYFIFYHLVLHQTICYPKYMKIFYYIKKPFCVKLLIVCSAIFLGVSFYVCTSDYEKEQFDFPPCLMYQEKIFQISPDLSTIRDNLPDGYIKAGEIKQTVTYPQKDWDSNSCPVSSEIYRNPTAPGTLYVYYASEISETAMFHLYLDETRMEEEQARLLPKK